MPSLRDLKKRLQSVKTTGQLAGAMRTVSTAKYSRASSSLKGNAPYSAALNELASVAGGSGAASLGSLKKHGRQGKKKRREEGFKEEYKERVVLVLISGNRGLCGGYNHELFNFFSEKYRRFDAPLVVACGRMAAEYCREKHIPLHAELSIKDVPSHEDADALYELVFKAYTDGGRVIFCFQRFINMLKQSPVLTRFLPPDAEQTEDEKALGLIPFASVIGGADEKDAAEENDEVQLREPDGRGHIQNLLFIPDRETVLRKLLPLCLKNGVYTLLLQCASGAQAATLMAMRAAYDNAASSAQQLETAINRRRQALVTQSVIETAAESEQY